MASRTGTPGGKGETQSAAAAALLQAGPELGLCRHNEGAATTTAAAAAAAAAVSKPQQQVQQGRYTLQDLLVVIPSSHDRLSLVEAGRAWRKGMQAFIVLDRPLDTRSASQSFLDGREEYRESFGHYADVTDGHVWSTPGDARCSGAGCPA